MSELTEQLAIAQEKRIEQLVASSEKIIDGISATWGRIIPIVLVFFSIVSLVFVFYGIKSISDVRKEAKEVAMLEVDKTLRDKDGLVIDTELLSKRLTVAKNELQVTEETIKVLNAQIKNDRALEEDVSGLYATLSNEDINRSLKFQNLEKLISLGKKGLADPNILFNASSDASRLDFDFEALQLLSIVSKLEPKPVYTLRRSRFENVFGTRFELVNGEFVRTKVLPQEVRLDAWGTVKKTIIANPIHDPQLTYSELWNIAERSNYAGYQQDAIDLILSAERENQDTLSSYPFVILAQLYASQSYSDWEANTWKSISKAVARLRAESPVAGWHAHTRKELCTKLAGWLNAEARINAMLEKHDLEPCEGSDSQDEEKAKLLQQLLEQLEQGEE